MKAKVNSAQTFLHNWCFTSTASYCLSKCIAEFSH